MFQKETLIPIAGVLVFVVALVGLLFGADLGWVDMLRQIPPLVYFAIIGVVFLLGWRMRPGASVGNIGRNIWLAFFIFSVLVLAWQFISYFQGR